MFLNLADNLFLLLFIGNCLRLIVSSDIKVSCKNEKGENVDWYYVYKLPEYYSDEKVRRVDNSGLSYMYLTSTSYDKWTLSESKINESSSIPARTLDHLFADPSVRMLAYNDEFPDGKVVYTGGHAKGVYASDDNTGIWLIHSVPKFPAVTKYAYPPTGARYGQSFLCITFNASTEEHKIWEQLSYIQPNVYFSRIPQGLSHNVSDLEEVLDKQWINTTTYNRVQDITSLQGSVFKSFAKSSEFNKELYEDFVAPTLHTNLLVETWRNGGGNFHSNCSLQNNVYNIKVVQMPKLKLNFHSTLDHSKWAVSQSVGLKFWRWFPPYTTNWVCVGDINRQHHQLVRGGGVLCQQNKTVAKQFRSLVKEYESC